VEVSMDYRIANEKDIPELATLRWDFKMEDKETEVNYYNKQELLNECEAFLKQGFKDRTWTHWIATHEDTIISNVSVHHIRKIPKPNRYIDKFGYVTNVYTRPEFRGQTIGSKLMDYVKDWSVENDFELLIVWPSSNAVKFYERKGFCNENDVLELVIRPDI
jgi:ribosomal protein S18 acetylase RimI-like enzyme